MFNRGVLRFALKIGPKVQIASFSYHQIQVHKLSLYFCTYPVIFGLTCTSEVLLVPLWFQWLYVPNFLHGDGGRVAIETSLWARTSYM